MGREDSSGIFFFLNLEMEWNAIGDSTEDAIYLSSNIVQPLKCFD